MSAPFHRTARLNLAAQAHGLRQLFPNGTTVLERDELRWRGPLAPDDYARTYDVEMRYHKAASPEVWVRSPDLHEISDGRPLPHVYEQESQKLCLFVPGCGFWTPSRAIALTILPWACYWLRLFEMWLATGIWHERGVHPRIAKPRSPAARAILF